MLAVGRLSTTKVRKVWIVLERDCIFGARCYFVAPTPQLLRCATQEGHDLLGCSPVPASLAHAAQHAAIVHIENALKLLSFLFRFNAVRVLNRMPPGINQLGIAIGDNEPRICVPTKAVQNERPFWL